MEIPEHPKLCAKTKGCSLKAVSRAPCKRQYPYNSLKEKSSWYPYMKPFPLYSSVGRYFAGYQQEM